MNELMHAGKLLGSIKAALNNHEADELDKELEDLVGAIGSVAEDIMLLNQREAQSAED